MNNKPEMNTHFSHYFAFDAEVLQNYGAFNVSLINDLPLFIDPFLLFNSNNSDYRKLHEQIIKYLRFLRDKSLKGEMNEGLLYAWFTFPEIKQTWFGFSETGNKGRGLGIDFARALNKNLNTIFASFGKEKVSHGSHLEKLCLIKDGVGRDNISDFTTNLIKEFLLEYTQEFAKTYLPKEFAKSIHVKKVRFNYSTESWVAATYTLPFVDGDYVILTPKDMLTKDEIWINKDDLINDYDQIVEALPNLQLRDQLNNYLLRTLPEKATPKEKHAAITSTIREFPQFLEYYILHKENNGDKAVSISEEKVFWSENLFIEQARELVSQLQNLSRFYTISGNTYSEAKLRAEFLKDIIENKGGWRFFYVDGEPLRRESDLQILYRLTWFATPSDVSREANDGRGPADFKISRGSLDKSIVEFKLASNTKLKANLEKQVEIYKKASDARFGVKVIMYFTETEYEKVISILRELNIENNRDIILIDGRKDNKTSASKA